MRWAGGRRSDNIEDRRGMPTSPMSRGLAGGGIGLVVLVLLALFFGVDPSVLVQGTREMPAPPPVERPVQAPPANDPAREFVSVVLADTEDTWNDLFRRMNRNYQEPRLVLFTEAIESACGFAQAAVGPFYCPLDHKLYLDMSFFRDLFGAPGDFAQAYVIAHEVGHHVQTLLGITEEVMSMRQRLHPAQASALQVRMELQADCFAGVWARNAHESRKILEQGDIEEGLNAASAIGDDRLQRQSRGYISPESFTHGSSAQRVRWFKRGLNTGDPRQCDTFSAANP
jgi:uncharacterized protein